MTDSYSPLTEILAADPGKLIAAGRSLVASGEPSSVELGEMLIAHGHLMARKRGESAHVA